MRALSSSRLYRYVGPPEIAARCRGEAPGHPVRELDDLRRALRAIAGLDVTTCTYVLDEVGVLRLADRASEHVACAGGGPVLAAGEMTLSSRGEVIDVSNQSTGFCPEPACWNVLASALDTAGITRPETWSTAVTFRRCASCGARNLVKDEVFECAECDVELPASWNFDRTRCRRALVRDWHIDLIEEAGDNDQDRVALFVDGDVVHLAIADGAGGTGGGTAAADRAVQSLASSRDADLRTLLERLDAELEQVGGECATAMARVRGEVIEGASVGDVELCVRQHGVWTELTQGQARKPLVGSGRARPRSFDATSVEWLFCATDGVMKYAPWPALVAVLERAAPSLPWDIANAARLPTGTLNDDLCAVLMRPARSA